jgi:anti-sigma regulatory factor (Ser/Thr protein kinase)
VDEARAVLEPSVGAPRSARQVVESFLRAHELECVVDDAVLLTSELVTNVVDHARSTIALSIEWKSPVVRVEVRDHIPGRVVQSFNPSGTSGRGLLIVDALSDAWGTYDTSDGKVVWFHLSARSCERRKRL